MPFPLANLITELRRRRVFRVAAFYGGIAFVIIQIIDGTFEVMGIPAWVSRMVIIFLVLGFPVSMILAWVFDITPEGIVRTKGRPVDAERKPQPLIGNKALVVIAIIAIIFGIWGQLGNRTSDLVRVAVLPFDNYSDQAEEWFSDGITDNITTQLAKISGLTIIGRTSVMQYKGTTKRLKEIGAELGVDALLEGSVQKIGGKVRIVAQLIDAKSEGHLWTDSYDAEMSDDEIFTLQSNVARIIAEALVGELSDDESKAISKVPTASRDAYNLYLKGIYYWNKRTRDDILQAIDYFEQAIAADPDYADAYAGLAMAYGVAHQWADILPELSYPKGQAAALQALKIDPRNAGAYTALAYAYEKYDYDWKKAEGAYLDALRMDSDHPTAHQWYGEMLSLLGREEESLNHLEMAASLDPLSMIILATLGYWQISWEHSNEGLRTQLEGERLFGVIAPAIGRAYRGYHKLKRYEEAFQSLQAANQFLYPDSLQYLVSRGDSIYSTQGYNAYYNWDADDVRGANLYSNWLLMLSDGMTIPGPEWIEAQKKAHSDWFFAKLGDGIAARDIEAWFAMGVPNIHSVFGDDPRYLAMKKKMNLP